MGKAEAYQGVTTNKVVYHSRRRRNAPVTFRLNGEQADLLEARAKAFGQSPNHFAKQVVVREIEQRLNDELHRDLRSVRRELSELRSDVRRIADRPGLRVVELCPSQPADPLAGLQLPRR